MDCKHLCGAVLMLSGCETTTEGMVSEELEASMLRCLGYCELIITDRAHELDGIVEMRELEVDADED